MNYNVAFISLGCAKNQVNCEQMMAAVQAAGHTVLTAPDGADVVVVNTCGFLQSACEEAIDNILQIAELKAAGRVKKILVTGCMAQRYKEQVSQELPEVDGILGTGSYGEIVSAVEEAMAGEHPARFDSIHSCEQAGERILSTPAWYAYLRIAEGCDNHCAYCVIPSLRGRYRSRPMEKVLDEARLLAAEGTRELIVIAQDITRYGLDSVGRQLLPELLRELGKIEGIEWIRLHYLYPHDLTDELIDTIAAEPKVLKYLDIPIQHIDDGILKRMNRRGDGAEVRALFKKLRQRIPGLVLRTSLITGLPGEGEAEFEELCDFLREAKIERAGTFPYSPEEGTPAADMPRPSRETAEHRAELIDELQSRIMDEFNDSRVGKTYRVLCEGFDRLAECWYGRSWAESPDIDGKIFYTGGSARPGELLTVLMTGTLEGDMLGEAVEDGQ